MSYWQLPDVNFDDCEPDVKLSEIQRLYVALQSAADFTDWTNSGEWAFRVLNGSMNVDAIRELTVIGDVPEALESEVEISGGRTATVTVERHLNFDIDDTRPLNYEFIRASQCGTGLKVKVWYYTAGKVLFGGNSGVKATILIEPVFGRKDEIEKYTGTARWFEKRSPERTEILISPTGHKYILAEDETPILWETGEAIETE